MDQVDFAKENFLNCSYMAMKYFLVRQINDVELQAAITDGPNGVELKDDYIKGANSLPASVE